MEVFMRKVEASICMLCEKDLTDSLSAVHAECVPFDKLVVLCNCGEVKIEVGKYIGEMIAFYNETLETQKPEELLKPLGGQFLLVSECSRCNQRTTGEDLQIMFVYDRRSELN